MFYITFQFLAVFHFVEYLLKSSFTVNLINILNVSVTRLTGFIVHFHQDLEDIL